MYSSSPGAKRNRGAQNLMGPVSRKVEDMVLGAKLATSAPQPDFPNLSIIRGFTHISKGCENARVGPEK